MAPALKIICPDLSLRLGFCPDCYRKNVQVIGTCLTCFCDCNRVGAYAEIIVAGDKGAENVRLGSWRMKMDVSREDFNSSIQKQGWGRDIPVEILFNS